MAGNLVQTNYFNQNKEIFRKLHLISIKKVLISLQSILNTPAEQNAANNPEDKTEAKKEEQKFCCVLESVSNGSRINPFPLRQAA